MKGSPPSRRLNGLDTLRGEALLSMILYHGCWDLVWLWDRNIPWYTGTFGFLWQRSICLTFILLSGFCWPMSRKPVRHALILLLAGAAVTLATVLVMPENAIFFGVLTLLGVSALLTVFLSRLPIPPALGLFLALALFLLCRKIPLGQIGVGSFSAALPPWLYRSGFTAFLGFPAADFASADYFPLLPWLFLFWSGYFLYGLIGGKPWLRRLPSWRPLSFMGRHSLWVYLLHQPVLYLIFYLFRGLIF